MWVCFTEQIRCPTDWDMLGGIRHQQHRGRGCLHCSNTEEVRLSGKNFKFTTLLVASLVLDCHCHKRKKLQRMQQYKSTSVSYLQVTGSVPGNVAIGKVAAERLGTLQASNTHLLHFH